MVANYDNIPQQLRDMNQWVCWKYEIDAKNPDRKKKVPVNPANGEYARSNDPATWTNFAAAVTAMTMYKLDGIGIMFANGVFGVDIDHCFNPETGEMDADAVEIIAAVRSYTEFSPSGTGIHILCYGTLPNGRRRKGNVEMYSSGRFFTVTGNQYGEQYPFSDCSERIKSMHQKYLAENETQMPMQPSRDSNKPVYGMTVDDIIKRASRSKQGQKFNDFLAGRWQDMGIGDGSQSCADQAFCNMLAFWCRCDESLMDAIFRRSGMMRDKWDTRRGGSTYGMNTIQRSIRDCREVWQPPQQNKAERGAPSPLAPLVNTQTEAPSIPDNDQKPKEEAKKPLYYAMDDTGNAKRFRDTYKDEIRFDHINKQWMYWDGRRWASDKTGEIKRKADAMLEDMQRQLRDDPELPDPTGFRKHITRSRGHRSKEAFIMETQHLMGIPVLPSDLDKPRNAFNTKNGMISLKTGNFVKHDKQWMLTKLADVNYRPDAKCPRWLSFLDDITMGDKELQLFLQRMAGYCLTGETKEQCLFFLYGNGANGKSTFVDTLSKMMGEYAVTCQPETVMVRDRNNNARPDLAKLRGARMVATSEPNEGSRLDEGIVKQMTGGTGNEIVARFLYGDEFSFVPEFKIVMSTNYKPVIKGTDNGIWRRVRLIPFNAKFEKDKKDPSLPDKLLKELPGILNWAIQGAVGWHKDGLPSCHAVDGAVEEYRAEMDRLQQFEEDCLIRRDGASLQASMLYQCYKNWCAEQGDRYPVSSVKFYGEFKKRCESRKTAAYNEYLGIAFNDHGLALSSAPDKGGKAL